MQDIRNKYHTQKSLAKRRGIRFLLTFGEWWEIWQGSGHWPQRGKGTKQYVMARYHDSGPYVWWNVKIILARDNVKEAQRGRKHSTKTRIKMRKKRRAHKMSPEHCANISKALRGRKHSAKHRANSSIAHTGHKHSAETRAKMSASHIGKKHSAKTRAKISAWHQKDH